MHRKEKATSWKGMAGCLNWTAVGLLLVALFVQPVAAQTAEDAIRFTQRSPATGARMMGMGGAGIVGVADYSALFSNPAGLGFAQSSSASGSLHSVYTTDQSFYNTLADATSLEGDVNATTLGNLAYVYRAPTRRGSFVVAAAFNQVNSYERDLRFQGNNNTSTISTSFLPFDDEFSFDANDNVSFFSDLPSLAFNAGVIDFNDDESGFPFIEAVGFRNDSGNWQASGVNIEQIGAVTEEGRISELSFGGAVEASPRVMVGLSANIAFGTYEFSSSFTEEDVDRQLTSADYDIELENGELLEGFDFLEYRQRLQSDLLGVNLRLGLSGQAGSSLRFGLTLETPTYYTVNEDFGMDLETLFDQGGNLSSDIIGEFEYEIQTPWRVGVGIGFFDKNVVLTGDVEYVDWSQLELDAESDPAFFNDLNLGIEETYQPVINTRLGIEYWLGDLALRGGFAYQPDPIDTQLLKSDGSPLERDKTFFSAGIGYRFQRQFQVDFGWMQGRSDSVFSAYPEDSLGPRQEDVLLVDEEVVQNQFSLGVSFLF